MGRSFGRCAGEVGHQVLLLSAACSSSVRSSVGMVERRGGADGVEGGGGDGDAHHARFLAAAGFAACFRSRSLSSSAVRTLTLAFEKRGSTSSAERTA